MIGQLGQSLPDDAKIRPPLPGLDTEVVGADPLAGKLQDAQELFARRPERRLRRRQRRFRDPQVRHCHSRHARGFARVAWRSGSPFIENTDIGRLRFIEVISQKMDRAPGL
jgi:hypothetical protein